MDKKNPGEQGYSPGPNAFRLHDRPRSGREGEAGGECITRS